MAIKMYNQKQHTNRHTCTHALAPIYASSSHDQMKLADNCYSVRHSETHTDACRVTINKVFVTIIAKLYYLPS